MNSRTPSLSPLWAVSGIESDVPTDTTGQIPQLCLRLPDTTPPLLYIQKVITVSKLFNDTRTMSKDDTSQTFSRKIRKLWVCIRKK